MNVKLQRDGFTLIELLVVVGILGILASLLTTAIISAKTRASNIQCTANLKQLGVSLNRFVQDNACYPLNSNPDPTNVPDHGNIWHRSLFPEQVQVEVEYSRGRGVFQCPAAPTPTIFPKNLGFASFGYNSRGLTGNTNEQPLGIGGDKLVPGDWRTKSPTHESEVANPSTLIAIGDGLVGWNGVIRDGVLALERRADAIEYFGSTKRAQKRHRGKANIVFCDGHVEGVPLTTLFTDTSDAALSMWNKDGLPHRERLTP